jgi:peroxiredoxin Q/BCP
MIGSTHLEEFMRKLFCVLAGGLVAVNLFAQATAPPKTQLKEGDTAPDFTLNATTGGKVTLSEFRGKFNVVLAFFPAAFTGG